VDVLLLNSYTRRLKVQDGQRIGPSLLEDPFLARKFIVSIISAFLGVLCMLEAPVLTVTSKSLIAVLQNIHLPPF
jgi:hypothetical protein